jgi:flagellin
MSGLVVATNMNAISIENILGNTNSAVSSSLEKLSSGLRINSAADDPAGFAVANSFKAKIASMQVASQNAGEAQSMLQTADGAYTQINNILVQMKSLATEASSGQTSDSNLTGEFQALQSEIDNIATSTQYNGTDLIDGTLSQANGGVTFQVGALNVANNQLNLSFNNATSTALGVSKGLIQVNNSSNAQLAMDALDTALTSINLYMSSVGALQNELSYTANNLTVGIQNFTSSASTIEDVDMASEVSTLTQNQILQQTAMAMLAQANQQPQSILKLLQ